MTPKKVAAERPMLVPSVLQAVCAGFPSPADDYLETLDLTALLIGNPPATFLWRVEGDSMIDEGIHPDDFVLVDRSLKPRDGDVVIAIIDGERSLKKVRRIGRRLTLGFANRAMPAFELSDGSEVEIWGVVAWGLRRLRPQGIR